ncbi:ABC transporter permease [Staphylococcus massiliensis]|uniref:ABC transporter permease n=1 Tax=Staphylococcus massiliensis S46 TaxID=1229783 RepID=K9AGU0_9STAP|nr:ABC transporter permease [Staphylococcus massiliensis]EKU45306.1 hypothetical protein C273_11421 [Staphylococcus massiliensis S46]MCG3413638.1 ABC transporter permease [Staphylococcus massiliensis]
MNLKNYLKLEILREIKNIYLYLALGLSLVSGAGIIYSIHNLNGPFNDTHVSGLYASISVIAMSLFSVKVMCIDFHYNVSQLILTTKINRIKFLFTKFLVSLLIGLAFSLGCIILLKVNSVLNNFKFNLIDCINVICHYLLFMAFYSLLVLVLIFLTKNIATLYVIIFILNMIIPGILQKITTLSKVPDFIKTIVKESPFLTLPENLPDLSLSSNNVVVIVISIIILFLISYIILPKKDL